jgi:hypothetical protein
MSAPARRPAHERWCDAGGNHISLFCLVEQVTEAPEPGALPSRLHQPGQVLGRGLDSLYVRFEGGHLVSLAPQLLRLLPDTPGPC